LEQKKTSKMRLEVKMKEGGVGRSAEVQGGEGRAVKTGLEVKEVSVCVHEGEAR
jgi:hypothetical protein